MFTGIVECTGVVATSCGKRGGALTVRPTSAWQDLVAGESIAVNGACLTLTGHGGGAVTFDVVPETARVSAVGALAVGAAVNLERALRVGDRMGGHYVLGHVDCVGRVSALTARGNDTELRVEFPARWGPFVLPKGSIAVNGVSLTVGAAGPSHLSVYLIPFTLRETNLVDLAAGAAVNLEFDYFGKWVCKLTGRPDEDLRGALGRAGFTMEDLWNT
jgi:riboflavin synthase